jgi:hypothetical protein
VRAAARRFNPWATASLIALAGTACGIVMIPLYTTRSFDEYNVVVVSWTA